MNEQTNPLSAIGNTPIVKLQKIVPENAAEGWVKLEGIFSGGSTGLNICAAIEIAKEIGPGKKL